MKSALKHIGWFFKLEWKRYLVCFIFLVIVSVLPIFPAKILGIAIDDIVNQTITKQSLILYVSLLIAIPVMVYVSNIFYHYMINALGYELSFKLREQYISHLFDLDSTIYEEYTKGDLIARATNDLDSITVLATSFFQSVIFGFSKIIAATVMMLLISPILTLASVAFMPIAIFYLNYQRKKKRAYYKIHHQIYGEMTENVLESIEGAKTVRAYCQEENDFKKTKVAIDADVNSWWKILKFEAIYNPLFQLVYVIAYTVAISLGTFYVVNSKMSAGDLVTFLLYVNMFLNPLVVISNVLNNISNINIADERFFEIMDKQPNVTDVEDSKSILTFKKIEYKNVSFRYNFDNFNTLTDINLTINNGETIGIVGPTGCGKTTLIRQLLREFNLTSGEIYIDGLPIENYKIDDLHELVGYVPQSNILFRRSIDENIMIGNPNATDRMIKKAIEIADFKKDINDLPNGESTMVAELGGSLSGGQRGRLSIARALVKDPQILILDDSLSAVDAITEQNIIKSLKESREGKTNIIISHRFSSVEHADKIVVLQNGRITDIGTHQELLKYDNWYKMQYINQIRGDRNEES